MNIHFFLCVNPKGSIQKVSDKNAWVLISTLAKPKINGLNPGYLKFKNLQYLSWVAGSIVSTTKRLRVLVLFW